VGLRVWLLLRRRGKLDGRLGSGCGAFFRFGRVFALLVLKQRGQKAVFTVSERLDSIFLRHTHVLLLGW